MSKTIRPQIPRSNDRRRIVRATYPHDAALIRHRMGVKPHTAAFKTQAVMWCDWNGIARSGLAAANTPRQIQVVADRPDDQKKTKANRRQRRQDCKGALHDA